MNIDELEGLDEATRKEVEKLLTVTREKDGNEEYVYSRFSIFYKVRLLEDCNIGIEALKDIKIEDSDYDIAQCYIVGEYLFTKNNIELAFEALKNIRDVKETRNFNYIFLRIAQLYIVDLEKRDTSKAAFALNLCKSTHCYEVNCYLKICALLDDAKTKVIGEYYLELFIILIEAHSLLVINYNHEKEKSPERKLAHYTNTNVANILLNNELDDPKYIRLNTISNVNDPSEGQLLELLLDDKGSDYNESYFNKDFHAFISCFTLNHDSLNQFRLYGKKDNKEASGISIVFKGSFFQKDKFSGMSFLSVGSKKEHNAGVDYSNATIEKNISIEEDSNKYLVMRCVYVDPKSDYIQLAHRDRLTFYREFDDKSLAESSWETYQNEIKEKSKDFGDYFYKIKVAYRKILNEKKALSSSDEKSEKYCEKLLDEILLPLKYLIKHSAFQEEQECRMVYITSLEDTKVKMIYGEALYVDYELNVRDYLDKVYIAPAATQYQPYLAKLLCNTDVKIELSNNPYRQT